MAVNPDKEQHILVAILIVTAVICLTAIFLSVEHARSEEPQWNVGVLNVG